MAATVVVRAGKVAILSFEPLKFKRFNPHDASADVSTKRSWIAARVTADARALWNSGRQLREGHRMDFRHDELYCDRTWFDVLGARCAQQLGRCVPQNRAEIWTHAFALFAALCVAWAAGLATQCMLFERPANQCLAQLVAAGLLLAAARHFLAATGMSARGALSRRKPVVRDRRRTRGESTQHVAASRIAAPGLPAKSPAGGRPNGRPAERSMVECDARLFFGAVKAAGINVRIARTLYVAGFRSAAQVRACEDAHLLAIDGIGRATLRKLRVQFGFSESESSRHSSAA